MGTGAHAAPQKLVYCPFPVHLNSRARAVHADLSLKRDREVRTVKFADLRSAGILNDEAPGKVANDGVRSSCLRANLTGLKSAHVRVVLGLHIMVVAVGFVKVRGVNLLDGTSATRAVEYKLPLLLLQHCTTRTTTTDDL